MDAYDSSSSLKGRPLGHPLNPDTEAIAIQPSAELRDSGPNSEESGRISLDSLHLWSITIGVGGQFTGFGTHNIIYDFGLATLIVIFSAKAIEIYRILRR
ncbi:MAG: hypothetical protein AAFR64_03465 [Pseudomonadota bacterium]